MENHPGEASDIAQTTPPVSACSLRSKVPPSSRWNLVATPFIGRSRLRWGTVGTEATDPLQGDELVPQPKWSYTLGIAVDAPPEAVWPWIAQIGQGRGGFYTYQTLENLAGCKIKNTNEILPDHQHPAVGEDIYLHPTAPPLRIEIVDPPHSLVLFGSPADIGGRGQLGGDNLAVRRQPRPRWGQSVSHQGPLRPLTRLEEPPHVWTLPDRSTQLRDEPQDDARDQAVGRAPRREAPGAAAFYRFRYSSSKNSNPSHGLGRITDSRSSRPWSRKRLRSASATGHGGPVSAGVPRCPMVETSSRPESATRAEIQPMTCGL